MRRGIGRLRAGGSAAFSPASLFSAGAKGVWFDPYDLSTMFQDSAGTTPVTADGQPIGKLLDKSGGGYHFTASGTARPTYKTSGGYSWIDWNGTSNGMSSSVGANASAFGGASQVVIVAGVRKTSDPGHLAVIFESRASVGSQAFGLEAPFDGTGGYAMVNAGSTFASAIAPTATYPDNVDDVLTGVGDVLSQISMIRVNGAQAAINVGNQGTSSYVATGGEQMYLGARTGSSFFFTGRMYGFMAIAGSQSIDIIQTLENWMAAKSGATITAPASDLAYVSTPSFLDTGTVDNSSLLFQRTSPFARAEYTTTATNVKVTTFTTLESSYIAGADIGVFVNGVYSSDTTVAQGYATSSVSLSAGSKTLSIATGSQSRANSGKAEGCFITKISADAPLTPTNASPVTRLLIYGDSIAVGDAATQRAKNGWAMLLRAGVYPRSVALEAWGFRSLFEDCPDSAGVTSFVAKLVAYNPSNIYLCIGTNDYGLNKWSAASFGTQYAALLDAIHAALPSVTIFAQTPLKRSTETANGSGSTLGDYRTQIANAQSTRSSYCTLVDGTTLYTFPANISGDGIHPTTAGHAQIATAIQAIV